MRRRTAKKRVMKRRPVKGGAYEGPGKIYNRFKDGTDQILYKLTSEKVDNYTKYTLDFTASNATYTAIPDIVIKKKYKSVFKSAFNVKDPNSIAKIDELIENLFIGGITNGVKRRKIVLTDQMDGNVTIQLFEGSDEKFNAVIRRGPVYTDLFEGFLMGLGDDIMPEGQSKPVEPSRFSRIRSFFGSPN
jgi:hypothetical protein